MTPKEKTAAIGALWNLFTRVCGRRDMNERTSTMHPENEVRLRAAARVAVYDLMLSEISHAAEDISRS